MRKIWKSLLCLLPILISSTVLAASPAKNSDDKLWQQVYDKRFSNYEAHFGQLPESILKMANLTGIWPGGGLYVAPAEKLGKGLWFYTTFGMTNSDMPATSEMSNSEIKSDEQNRPTEISGTLEVKEKAAVPPGAAGYGYEMVVLTNEVAEWPLMFLQWTVNAEISKDARILENVIKNKGLTVQAIQVGEKDFIHVLISLPQSPLPQGMDLPNGKMVYLIATVITEYEMQWSKQYGREALLKKLIEAGVGQISIRNRPTVSLK